MSTGGGRPATTDVAEAVHVSNHAVYFRGKNANDGKPVSIQRVGESEYFEEGKKYRITYEPVED